MPNARHRSRAQPPPAPVELAYPLVVPDATVLGAVVLHEAPEAFALHVFRALRLAFAWAAGPDVSGALFDAEDVGAWEADVLRAQGIDPALWAPVSVIAGELARPAEVDPERLAYACLAVTDWALGCDAHGTGVMFAEAAAVVWPNNARIAWIVGKLYREQRQFSRAESWLRRASRIAVQAGDWELHAQAINSLGNLKVHVGDLAAGQELLLAAARVARRKQLREREAMVLHDLFVLCTYAGRFEEADTHAQRAFEAYGPDHPNAVHLAFDVSHLCARQGQFTRALQVLEPLRDRFSDPERRLRVLASIARAAGEAGDSDAFQASWIQAWEVIETADADHIRPAAALELGLGAIGVGRWDDAEAALVIARDGARTLRDAITLSGAESALQRLSQPKRGDEAKPANPPRTRAAETATRIARTPDAPAQIPADAN